GVVLRVDVHAVRLVEVTDHAVANREQPLAVLIEFADRINPDRRALDHPDIVLGINAHRDRTAGALNQWGVGVGGLVAQVDRVGAPIDAPAAGPQAAGIDVPADALTVARHADHRPHAGRIARAVDRGVGDRGSLERL